MRDYTQQSQPIPCEVHVAKNTYAVAGGAAVAGVITVAAAATYCRHDFADAVAAGDFQRAERRAGLLAVNDLMPLNWAVCGFLVLVLGLALIGAGL